MRTFLLLALALPLAADDLPAGPARDIILKSCDGCHKAADIPKYRHTKPEWAATIDRMARRANLNSSEAEILVDYLFANFPKVDEPDKVNVNTASAKEIEAGLGLTLEEAEAIVRYRERNQKFNVWGDLLVIYGVDGRKIQAAKDKMSF
jgi:competence protein ComEA